MRHAALLACAGGAAGHGSVLIPPPRNAIDSELPPWSNGKHPRTGTIEPLPCNCWNGTSPCNSGQNCFWFSQGCSIGCDACDGDGARLPNWDHCGRGKLDPKYLLDGKYRTANRKSTPGSPEDVWKYQPWRAPGQAPVYDPCGMAGGNPHPAINGGEYTTTVYAKQGDLGSVTLKPRPTGTVWKAGGVATATWYIAFNHGGGYQYRLCPATEPLTEACFQARPLAFANTYHTFRLQDGSGMQVNNTVVQAGGGKGWMMSPIPNSGIGQQCDKPDGHACPHGCNTTAGTPTAPSSCGDYQQTEAAFPNPYPKGGPDGNYFGIEDDLHVPNVPPGEYVLGWRWDCETSSQIWQACSDITIA